MKNYAIHQKKSSLSNNNVLIPPFFQVCLFNRGIKKWRKTAGESGWKIFQCSHNKFAKSVAFSYLFYVFFCAIAFLFDEVFKARKKTSMLFDVYFEDFRLDCGGEDFWIMEESF
jgi:hypothetical protein